MRTGWQNGLFSLFIKPNISHPQNKTRVNLTPVRGSTLLQDQSHRWGAADRQMSLTSGREEGQGPNPAGHGHPGARRREGWDQRNTGHQSQETSVTRRSGWPTMWRMGSTRQGRREGVFRPRSHVVGAKLCPLPKFICWGPNSQTSQCYCTWRQGL